MANVTRTCTSKGASVTFTINDVTLRCTQVQWLTVTNAIKIKILNLDGSLALEINSGVDISPKTVDLEARLVEIIKADLSTKSYLHVPFAVYF